MRDSSEPTIRLFSYGTLRQPAVQLANFGRRLTGEADAVAGYRLSTVAIDDPEVVAESGVGIHPIMIQSEDGADSVPGTVFLITQAELDAADDYETGAYIRVEVTLVSGGRAWAYVAPTGHSDGSSTL
jgi:gamma-glutamylcyclotransferase (GGCT)/AIG2-like uncharacterized protein YtfP